MTGSAVLSRAAMIGVAISSASGGIAVAVLPLRTAVACFVAVSAALLLMFGRKARPRQVPAVAGSSPPSTRAHRLAWFDGARASDSALRVPRLLFYAGLLLIGQLTLRPMGTVTYSDLLFLTSMALACAELVMLRRRVGILLPSLLLVGMGVFVVGGLLSSFHAHDALRSCAVIVRLIFLTVFWFWLGTVLLERREHLVRAVTLWVASAAISGAAAFLQLLAGDVIPGTDPVFGRLTGFTGHPNDLGGLTSIAFLPALMLAGRRDIRPRQRVYSLVLLLFVGGGLVLSGSVGAMLALAIAVLVWICLERTSRRSVLVFAVLAASAVGMIAVQEMRSAPTPLDRIRTVTSPAGDEGAGSLELRVLVYNAASQRIRDQPFIGVGFDLVSVTKPFGVVSYAYDVHHIFIGTWYKGGLLALLGLGIVLLAGLRSGWHAIRASTSEDEGSMAVALTGALVAMIVFGMTAPIVYSRYGWVAAALLLALRAAQRRAPVSVARSLAEVEPTRLALARLSPTPR